MEVTTTTGTGNVTTALYMQTYSAGVIGERGDRLTYWRGTERNHLNRDNLQRLLDEQMNMYAAMTPNDVRCEAADLRAEAGFAIQRAIEADDWMVEGESVSRDCDYRALVALARAKMLDAFADLLEQRA